MAGWADRRSYTRSLQRLGVDAGPEGQSFIPATQFSYILADSLNVPPIGTRFGCTIDAVNPGGLMGVVIIAPPQRGVFVDQVEQLTPGSSLILSYLPPVAGLVFGLGVETLVWSQAFAGRSTDAQALTLMDGTTVTYATATAIVTVPSFTVTTQEPLLNDSLMRRLWIPANGRFHIFTAATGVQLRANIACSLGLGG